MFTTIILTFVVVIALCLAYRWGHANGYRDACYEYRRYLGIKDTTILYPL